MNYLCKLVTFVFLCALLFGCSYLPDRSSEYLDNSQTLSGLTIPPGFGTSQVGDDFIIPNTRNTSRKNLLLPPESLALEMSEGKLTKKELKERELSSRMTQITWSQSKFGTETLMANRSLKEVWSHLQRALQKLSASYRVKSKDEALATLYLYDLSATQGKLKPNTPLYQLRLVESENGTMIMLATGENETPLSPDSNQRILEKLRQALDDTKEGLSFKQWLGW